MISSFLNRCPQYLEKGYKDCIYEVTSQQPQLPLLGNRRLPYLSPRVYQQSKMILIGQKVLV